MAANRIFLAKVESHCAECDSAIKLNDHITWPRRGDSRFRIHRHCGKDCSQAGCFGSATNDYSPTIAEESENAPLETVNGAIYETDETNSTQEGNSSMGNSAIDSAFSALAGALAPMIEAKISAKVDESTVKAIVDDAIAKLPKIDESTILDLIADATKSKTISIEVNQADKPNVVLNDVHQNVPTLLKLVAKRRHVYLHGPAGSFKSTGARQVAEALGLRYSHMTLGPLDPTSRLLGFQNITTGKYHASEFEDFYENGGVFCLEECDNTSAVLQNILNTGLENGSMSFPGKGLVKRHADFVLVATGNTCGRGGSRNHSERRAFDGAFSERFTFIVWNYDEALEEKIALSINPKAGTMLEWLRKVREFAKTNHPALIVSPRAAFRIAQDMSDDIFDTHEAMIEANLFKGLDKASVASIISANPVNW